MVPTLTTDRLTLRGWRDDDLDAYARDHRGCRGHALHGRRHRPGAEPGGRWRCSPATGSCAATGSGSVEREGELIGRIGLWQPEGWPGLEVGWLLGREAWGHGYATEAARASMEYAWSELGADRLISLIDPENVASQRVAERLGMRPQGEHYSLRGQPLVIHELTRAARPTRLSASAISASCTTSGGRKRTVLGPVALMTSACSSKRPPRDLRRVGVDLGRDHQPAPADRLHPRQLAQPLGQHARPSRRRARAAPGRRGRRAPRSPPRSPAGCPRTSSRGRRARRRPPAPAS